MTAKTDVKFPKIEEVTSERRTYRDSEMFDYEGKVYKFDTICDYCEEFLRHYKRFHSKRYHYFDEIDGMMAKGAITLVIDYGDICAAHIKDEETCHSNFLHHLLEFNPKLFLRAFRVAAHSILQQIHYDYSNQIIHEFKVRLSNANMFKKEITDISNDDVGRIIYTEDFVVSISAQKNYTKRMAWSCGSCGRLTYKDSIGFRLPRLKKCDFCESDDIKESIHDAVTDTMQEIKLQQKFEKIVSGRVPKTIMGVIFGKDMINPVQAGDICADLHCLSELIGVL